MARNFGLGSRDMGKAGAFAVNNASRSGDLSYSSAATISDRWNSFAAAAREAGIRDMKNIDRSVVESYGRELAARVQSGGMAAATAQNYLSAVNTVLSLATGGKWQSVSPTKDCGIQNRSHVRQDAPGALDRPAYGRALDAVRWQMGERVGAIVELARELGLRSKEASLIDARGALAQARASGFVTVSEGTKGGLSRQAPVSERGMAALERAASAQGGGRSMIPALRSWKEWRAGELRQAREIVQEHTKGGLHDLRAAYACQRYQEITGHAAPAAGGVIGEKEADREARQQIASELGHGRTDVVAQYIGGGDGKSS